MTTKSRTTAEPAAADEPTAGAESLNRLPSTDEMAAAATAWRANKGDTVFVPIDEALNNGDDYAPAIVTRVWDSGLINVRVIPDSNKIPEWRTSVKLHEQRPDEPGHDAWMSRADQ